MLVAASASYAAVLWWMTLRPSIYDDRTSGVLTAVLGVLASWAPTAWVTFGLVEFAANVVLFVPTGALVLAWGGRWWHGVVAGVVLSCAIESAQALWLPSRVADPRDVVANTLGALIGVALGVWIRGRGRRGE